MVTDPPPATLPTVVSPPSMLTNPIPLARYTSTPSIMLAFLHGHPFGTSGSDSLASSRRGHVGSGLPPYSALIPCLLYTSDAADEEDSVDLGGRRIIKKKKKIEI
eukprot:TRINITY_DN2981_c0_g1_i1.p4 TRINITY_DN2981_c0_g1~~TRINITY_DN2981_c0_g1_i1.p4  ORF type:complete len:105 (+),score=0.26 TRINITY_DN2981_c0_g1_i1:360-674(+)